jgi:hypothetical protein
VDESPIDNVALWFHTCVYRTRQARKEHLNVSLEDLHCVDWLCTMPVKFHLQFERPVAGSLPVMLDTDELAFSFIPSYIPYDSLAELVSALIAVVVNDTVDAVVRWNTEPTEYEFHFVGDASEIVFSVIQFLDSRRQQHDGHTVLALRGQRMEIVLPFWRALRELQSYEIPAEQWQHPFPAGDLDKLTALLQR